MDRFMREALNEAKKGLAEGGLPIGAVLVSRGRIIGRGHNQRMQRRSAVLHAEMAALEDAGRVSPASYRKCRLYSTLSPCDMCSGAILLYKIPLVIIGENENFKGPEDYSRSRGVKIVNLDLRECKDMLREFIKAHPKLWREDIAA